MKKIVLFMFFVSMVYIAFAFGQQEKVVSQESTVSQESPPMGSDSLIGIWVKVEGNIGIGNRIEFNKGGSGRVGDDNMFPMRWRATTSGKLTLYVDGYEDEFEYRFSGAELIIIEGNEEMRLRKRR